MKLTPLRHSHFKKEEDSTLQSLHVYLYIKTARNRFVLMSVVSTIILYQLFHDLDDIICHCEWACSPPLTFIANVIRALCSECASNTKRMYTADSTLQEKIKNEYQANEWRGF